ncbi:MULTISPECIES: hypothetical protein [unclassified Myroides]|uniref:hypothetical protein n=1 Tax=unclassified Myroides TaxID=2642485 RepID=UPI003D2F5926
MNQIIQRINAPTPRFFKILRTIGLGLAAISGGILAAPVALPAVLTTVASYLAVAGGIITAISQITMEVEETTPTP